MAEATADANASRTSSKGSSRRGRKKNGGLAAEKPETLRDYYRQMLLIRRFEERTAQAYTQARIGGYCHLNLGEEATIVGLMAALRPTDYLYTNYREHGYALGKGIEPRKVMAELYGRSTGVSKGWGGSMHMFDTDVRLLGGWGIVGGQLPLATGAALAVSYRGGDDVIMCQMGDGTTNIGAFHESLNIAALWNLPAVFVVINNLTGMGTTVEMASAEPDLYKRGSAYRIEGVRVDGEDPLAVRDAAADYVERARAEQRPFLLEAVSQRMKGHSVVDPAKYRTDEQKEAARAADPVLAFQHRLEKEGVLSEEQRSEIAEEIESVVTDAADFAENSPHPDVSTLFDYTYATPVPNESRRMPADPVFAETTTPAK
ncbi:pyruvate dehydrogenase (acetyl-transferring) E1 component subunit alpha [Spiractinospora alimapuensis]|uniref:pyruvate dehydrogenase (acetyl-transferring) E1 component subunit alpha n=1 Tax=Spiractinospora alimapuensis TaxID=2820884 RepID=UPI001EECA815|nr:pyruvate dehydrogenase (acetyl-transferring) E1 component subunit alpha [Spiractinospora alimapuensis]QVQ50539.1 pyruvate dehydrogenase (acetyl-transferring) E1 component subunit alpha [Spiractinospora alimapuensis]